MVVRTDEMSPKKNLKLKKKKSSKSPTAKMEKTNGATKQKGKKRKLSTVTDNENEAGVETITPRKDTPAKRKKLAKTSEKSKDDQQKPNTKDAAKESDSKKRKQNVEKGAAAKKAKKNYELSVEAKKVWEELRREDCPDSKKARLLKNLLNLIKGKVKEIVRAHDTARVVECIVKLGTEEHRTALFEELKDMIEELCKLKYAKFFVQKILMYGTKEQKNHVIQSFYGKVRSLLNHNEAASILEYAYNEVANHKQRSLLVQEYYGPQYILFKDENTTSLTQALKKASDSEKKKMLSEIKEELIKLTNKNSFKHSIAHFVYREFFKNASLDDKKEMASCLSQQVVEMLHTKDGSRVAMQCLWYGTPKDRKVILKSFKKFVANIAKEENGYLVLLAAFDCVDDVKLLEKAVIIELVASENAFELAKDKHGVKVFEYLISPRDPRFFHKDVVGILAEGDDNPYSKKDRETRVKELKEIAAPHLVKLVKDHAKELLLSGSTGLLLSNVLTSCDTTSKEEAIKEVAKVYVEEGLYHEGDTQHIIERGCASLSIKKLIVHDKVQQSQGKDKSSTTFSQLFVEAVPNTVLRSYIGCNRGCFLLLSLIETGIDSVVKTVKACLDGVNNKLRQKEFKGASLLLETLKN